MARSKTSKKWLKEHFDDPFVHRAQQEGYRSRASYKLLEMNSKDRLLLPGLTVVDLGAAPGGWSQVAADAVLTRKGAGKVVALDILEMEPLPGVDFLCGDFREDRVLQQLQQQLAGAEVDLVMSDMAPNSSGIKAVDQPRAMLLAELALDFSRSVLRPGGDMVVKMFQGEGFDPFLGQCRAAFSRVVSRKPEASRGRSREIYLVARGLQE
ncbi:MAG: 23S rRNA (uridine(2552)-2'-O)-methyltransferase RlmE [Gammaproteobacteria bacterium]|nr:23S rRNA (uridine(2552)-2'-O)-methyltransferase RlmE [Gammaproteobacteria bacterium]